MNRLKLLRGLARIFHCAKDFDEWDEGKHPRDRDGKFKERSGQSAPSGYNGGSKVSATGSHSFPKVLFKSTHKFKNHFKNHKDDLLKAGIRAEEEYKRETRRVIESPVGGDIVGHIASKQNGQIVRYDKRINLFVKGSPKKGVFTSFVPDGAPGAYYEIMKEKDLENDGEE